MRYFRLDDTGNPIEEKNPRRWGEWYQDNADSVCVVAVTIIGKVQIVTRFLPIATLNPDPSWETTIKNGSAAVPEVIETLGTRADAQRVHDETVARFQSKTSTN